jgi:tetratricopeptide (TPR) repeat protein
MGDADHADGNLPAAIFVWQQALKFTNLKPLLYRRLLAAHKEQKDEVGQIADLAALAELEPSDAQTHYQLGLLLAAHQPEEALPPLMRAAVLDPTLAQVARAIQTAVNIASLEKDQAYLLLSSGRALASLGEWQLAETAFTQATQLNPSFSEAWAYLGEAHLQNDQDGLPELIKALQLDPSSVVANTFLGLYWRGKGETARSLVYLDHAAGLEPGNPTLQAELGSAYAAMGNLPAALEHYQRAVQIAPKDALYWRTLANFSVDHQHQLHEVGLPAARQAVLLSPSDPASQDVLAQVYILLNNPLLAQRFLERALQVDPGYAPARLHLGVLYLLQGDLVQARRQLSLAFSLAGDDSATAGQAKRLLEHVSP